MLSTSSLTSEDQESTPPRRGEIETVEGTNLGICKAERRFLEMLSHF